MASPPRSITATRRTFLRRPVTTAAAGALAAAGCERRAPPPPGVVELDFYTHATPEHTESMTLLRDAFLGLRTVDDACRPFTEEVNTVLASGVS